MTKTILITGATDGIGRVAAQSLARDGHRLVIHGRSAEKLAATAEALGASDTLLADLSDLGATAEAARALSVDRIDVIVNNAGVLKTPLAGQVSPDPRLTVNTLAPALLTRLLLPKLAEDGRIHMLSSAAQAPVNMAALEAGQTMGDMDAYAQSKLALTMWAQTLAAELGAPRIVTSINPGSLLATNMVREGFGIAGNDISIGGDILVRAALSDDFVGQSGAYFDNDAGGFGPAHPDTLNATKVAAISTWIETLIAPYLD